MKSTKIKEIFTSIQGEGLYIGQLHTFVRFSRCNLNCKYCDTDFKNDLEEYSIDKLYNALNTKAETISLTGGEPLVEADFLYEFLKKYKNKLNKKIYLETNGTLYNELAKIIDFIDIIALDIKLKSSTGQKNQFENNEHFIDIAQKKEHFIKIVFDNNIDDFEIKKAAELSNKYNSTIILQPKIPMDKDLDLEKIFYKFYNLHKNTKLIPQTHKFLNLR